MTHYCPGCLERHRAGSHQRHVMVADSTGSTYARYFDSPEDPPTSCDTCLPPSTIVEGSHLCSRHGSAAASEVAQLRQLMTARYARLGVEGG